MKDRYTITRFDYELDEDAEDNVLADSDFTVTDLQGAIDAWESDCWDNEDWREDEVILYPADWTRNIRTGIVEHTDVVIKAHKPRYLEHLYNHLEARKNARKV